MIENEYESLYYETFVEGAEKFRDRVIDLIIDITDMDQAVCILRRVKELSVEPNKEARR